MLNFVAILGCQVTILQVIQVSRLLRHLVNAHGAALVLCQGFSLIKLNWTSQGRIEMASYYLQRSSFTRTSCSTVSALVIVIISSKLTR